MYAAYLLCTKFSKYTGIFLGQFDSPPQVVLSVGKIGHIRETLKYTSTKSGPFADAKHAFRYAKKIEASRLDMDDYFVAWSLTSSNQWPRLDVEFEAPNGRLSNVYAGDVPAWWYDLLTSAAGSAALPKTAKAVLAARKERHRELKSRFKTLAKETDESVEPEEKEDNSEQVIKRKPRFRYVPRK